MEYTFKKHPKDVTKGDDELSAQTATNLGLHTLANSLMPITDRIIFKDKLVFFELVQLKNYQFKFSTRAGHALLLMLPHHVCW